MRQEIRLFIEGREVEFSAPPQILFTYTQNELTNPSVIRNSYTKTLTIEGTPNNNNIFGHIWDLSRLQSYGTGDFVQTQFDPAKKADFTLYYNGEIYESGFVKLDTVRRTGHKIEMDLTLYGGLGGLFFDLQYDAEGNKLKLSDLVYTEGGDDAEFDMVISKETLAEAWDNIYSNSGKWSSINFAPMSEGDPDNFDLDRCVVNFKNAAVFSGVTSDGTEYLPKNGYGLGTLPDKLDMWATRDIRSYLVRPVLRVRALFEAIRRYAAVKGYVLTLDPDFFNYDNPYYDGGWITLPLLSEMKLNGVSEETKSEVTPTADYTITYNGWYDTIYRVNGELPLGTASVDLNMDFVVSGSTSVTGDLFTSALIGGNKNYAAFAVQLCAYEGATPNSTLITASTSYFLTSKLGNGDYLKPEQTAWRPVGTGEFKNSFGKWISTGSGTWKWSEPLSFHMDMQSNVGCLGLRINALANLESVTTYSGKQAQSYGYRRGKAYTATALTASNNTNTTTLKHFRDTVLSEASLDTYTKSGTAGFSGARIGKKIMLSLEGTPCDYLLSFCKMFNLFFLKEPDNKEVQILMRGNFYQTGETINVNDKIDRGNTLKIKPVPYESMWYNLSQEQAEGEFSQQYFNTYGTKYGTQRINTGYEFDVEEKKILDKSVFRSCVEGTGKSRYYVAPENFQPSGEMPAYVLQGFKYQLYNGDTVYEVDMGIHNREYQPLDSEVYYDLFPKPQFRDGDRKAVDGKNVLVFFNGYQDCMNTHGVRIPYWITDDLGGAMGTLNDQKACWIYTEDEYDMAGKRIAIKTYSLPKFQRNIYGWNGAISRSWDFGAPRQLFTDNTFWVSEAGIYHSFWRDYLKDFYSTDTRVVDAQMLIEQRPNPDFLRKFYWFDNSLWRLNKIDEWDVSSHGTTAVQFVRVNDLENYTSKPVTTAPTITLTLSKYTADKNGDTIEAYIHVSDGGPWYVENYDSYGMGLSADRGSGDGTITITVYSNTSGGDRELSLYVMADNSSAKATIVQASGVLYVELYNSDNVDGAGGTVRGRVFSSDPWTASTAYGGILTSISPSNGGGDENIGEEISITVAPNDFSSRRTAYIEVNTAYRHARSSNITQNGMNNPVVYLTPSTRYIGQSGETFTLTASANTDYSIQVVYDWLSVTPLTGTTGETQHTVTVAANNQYRRSTTIDARNTSGTESIANNSVLIVQSGVSFITYAAGALYGPRAADPTNLNTGFVDPDGNYLTAVTTNTYSPFVNNYIMTFGGDVAKITNGAMRGMNRQYLELYYVSLPDTVVEVSNHAFAENNYLSAVTTSARTITTSAFRDCPALSVLSLGSGVETIGDYAFYGDTALTSVTIPSTVTTIGCYAFGGCTGLTIVYYGGTMAAWENVNLCAEWRANTPRLTSVVCADGSIPITPSQWSMTITRIDGGGDVTSTDGIAYLNVRCTDPWTATTPYTSVISLFEPSTGAAGDTTVVVRFFNNTDSSRRQVYADFSSGDNSGRVYFTQEANGDPYVRFSPSPLNVGATGGTFTVNYTGTTAWTPYYWASWITCSPAFNETVPAGSGTLTVTVSPNTGTASRATSFIAYNAGGNSAVSSDSSFLIRQSAPNS